MNKKNVVVIGGGTGTFTVLKGLKSYDNLSISAIVTMADDGGSNKVLRDQFGLLPTSGVRQCIVALSSKESLLRELFSYRYHKGTGISGMTFGNLFMAALSDITASQRQSIKETCKLLQVKGSVLPASYDQTTLHATYQDGSELIGEHMIDDPGEKLGRLRITQLRTIPKVKLDKEAASAISQADLIVLGPGDLYTNSIANLVVKGMPEKIKKSSAKLVFVMNLMTKLGETYNYKASDYLEDLSKYLDRAVIDYIILNSDSKLASPTLKKYQKEEAKPVQDDLGKKWHQAKIIRTPLVSKNVVTKQKGDVITRSLVRHDSDLLAKSLVSLLQS